MDITDQSVAATAGPNIRSQPQPDARTPEGVRVLEDQNFLTAREHRHFRRLTWMLSHSVFKYIPPSPSQIAFVTESELPARCGFRLLKSLAALLVRDHEVVAIMPIKNGTEMVVYNEASMCEPPRWPTCPRLR